MAVPSDIANLELWLAPSSLSGAQGDPIGTWNDTSGNARHATQSISAERPTLNLSQIGARAGARFDGTPGAGVNGASLNLPDFLTGFTAGEGFVIIKVDNDPGVVPNSGLWTFGNSGQDVHYPYSDGVIYDGFGSNVRKTTVNPTPTLSSQYRLYNVTSKSGGWTNRLDGTQLFTTATNTVGWTTAPKVGLGGPGLFLQGTITELWIYSRELTTGERDSMLAYFNSQFPVFSTAALSASSGLSATGTVVKPATASMTARSTLSVSSGVTVTAAAGLSASSGITATLAPVLSASASMGARSSIAASLTPVFAASTAAVRTWNGTAWV